MDRCIDPIIVVECCCSYIWLDLLENIHACHDRYYPLPDTAMPALRVHLKSITRRGPGTCTLRV